MNNTNRDWYLDWEAKNIKFYPMDSCDAFLEIDISKAVKGDLEFLPTHKSNFPDHDPQVHLTLAIKPINSQESRWVCI